MSTAATFTCNHDYMCLRKLYDQDLKSRPHRKFFTPVFCSDQGGDVVLALGMRMPFYLKVEFENEQRQAFDQITIREVRLPTGRQKNGELTELIRYFFDVELVKAVQLESVQPKWFKQRLSTPGSPWVLQASSYEPIEQSLKHNPSFARFNVGAATKRFVKMFE